MMTSVKHRHPFLMVISPEQLNEINELLQDTAEYYCTENVMSGEKFWTVVECYAAAKAAEMRGELA